MTEGGKFDEHKAVAGARTEAQAKAIYNRNYENGWNRGKTVTRFTWDEFKAWEDSGEGASPATGATSFDSSLVSEPRTIPKERERGIINLSAYSTGVRVMASLRALGDKGNAGLRLCCKASHTTVSETS